MNGLSESHHSLSLTTPPFINITLRITNSSPVFGLVGFLLTQTQQCFLITSVTLFFTPTDAHLTAVGPSAVSNLLISMYMGFLALISTSLRPKT